MFKYMYIKYNDLISKCQSGFQPGVSTINQLVEIYDKTYDKIVTSSDKGKYIRFIFCDISKAFDRVRHQGVIHKLEGLYFGEVYYAG